MTKQEVLRALRNAFVTLYNNPSSIRRVVDDAGIDTGLVNFQGAALEIWYSVLTEAENQGKVDALVRAVDTPYQGNKALQQAYQAYLQANANAQSAASPSTVAPASSGSQVTINTGGGAYIAGNVNTGGGDFVGGNQDKFEGFTPKIESLTFTQRLWPIETKSRGAMSHDANYDFPTSEERFLDLGANQIYHVLYEQSNEDAASLSLAINAEYLCSNFLLNSAHQLIVGRRLAGKTWLRLYLERYVLITNAAPPPIFFFLPAHLQFLSTEVEIALYLAQSVAHQLFLRLLMQSRANPERIDTLLIIWSGIAPLLKKYDYDIYRQSPFLTQPVPSAFLLDIAQSYSSNQAYLQMKQLISNVPTTLSSTSPTAEQVLGHIQEAVEFLGYRRLFILIDNWDKIAERQRNTLSTQLLSPSLLGKLSTHNIYFKGFLPTIRADTLQHFQHILQLERQVGGNRFKLSLYSHS